MEKSEERLRTIGEVARISGVPVKTIRYYADIGLLPPAEVSESRYRLYGAEEVWRLGLIRALRHLDFSIEEVRAVISGGRSVSDAISLQLDALDNRLRHLERVRAILRQAEKDAADPERSLEHLRDIGAALAVEARDRERFLADQLRKAVTSEEALDDWREAFLRTVNFRIPEELDPKQAAAWVELVLLVKDPGFAAENRRHLSGLWETLKGRSIEAAWWHERLLNIGNRARTALERGAAPGSEEVQGIVTDYLAIYARAMGEEATPEFTRRLAEMVPRWLEDTDGKTHRFWELLAVLDAEDLISSQDQVNELIIAGLRHRAALEL